MTIAAAAVAVYGLPSALELPAREISDDEFGALFDACEHDRLLGLLAHAVRDGALRVSDDARALLEEELQRWLAHDLRVEQLLLDALHELAAASIPARVLKGVALAHTTYRDPAARVFGDADVLVPSAQFTRAAEILIASLSATRAMPELRPGFDDRFGKEILLRLRGSLELDLHRVFVDGALGLTIDLDDLFAPPYRFALGSFELETLPMPQRLLHAAYAAALGDWPPRLVSLRDLAQLVLHEQPNLVDVLLMAKRWRCEAVVARGVNLTWETLRPVPRPPIVEWAARFTPSRTDRLLLAAYQGPARSFTRHAASLVVLPDLPSRMAYLHAIALPQREYLRARGSSTTRHVRRAVTKVFR
jgi:Uncharacterised nucleotidyltransferase